MIIEEIRLSHFRNYTELRLTPHAGVNLLFGPNGSGKTNLLEAIHFCALGRSHRVSGDQNVVQLGEKTAICRVTVRNSFSSAEIALQLSPRESGRKRIQINGKKAERFSELMGNLRCVIFSPEDLGLIREGPSLRRRYLDMMISQVDRAYFVALQQYRVAMEQRNALLKQMKQTGMREAGILQDFEAAMSIHAEKIVTQRKRTIQLLAGHGEQVYASISGQEAERFHLSYHSAFRDMERISNQMNALLEKSREEDLRYGLTSVGPHRDDLLLTLNGRSMKQYASQGQIRTGALSLKLAQMRVLADLCGESPVLLLDDVMSELDRNRRSRLIQEIQGVQTFVTCTDESDLEDDRTKRVYLVHAVEGIASIQEKQEGTPMRNIALSEPDFS